MDEVGLVGFDALGISDCFVERLVRRVFFLTEGAHDEEVEILEFGVFTFGDYAYVGEVCHVAYAVACDGKFAV